MNYIVSEAQDAFQKQMVELQIDSLKIKDEEGKVVTGMNLRATALPDMWLPQFMMYANDTARLYTLKSGEKTIFEVGFEYDNRTLTGVRAVELSEDVTKEYGYTHGLLDNEFIKERILRHTLTKMVASDNGFARLVEPDTFHLADENDKYVRPMPVDLLVASRFREFSLNSDRAFEISLSMTNEPSLEL